MLLCLWMNSDFYIWMAMNEFLSRTMDRNKCHLTAEISHIFTQVSIFPQVCYLHFTRTNLNCPKMHWSNPVQSAKGPYTTNWTINALGKIFCRLNSNQHCSMRLQLLCWLQISSDKFSVEWNDVDTFRINYGLDNTRHKCYSNIWKNTATLLTLRNMFQCFKHHHQI